MDVRGAPVGQKQPFSFVGMRFADSWSLLLYTQRLNGWKTDAELEEDDPRTAGTSYPLPFPFSLTFHRLLDHRKKTREACALRLEKRTERKWLVP